MPTGELYRPAKLHIVRFRQPSMLAQIAQPLGYEAWRQRLSRSDAEIRQVFDPDNPAMTEKLLAKMKSKVGRFIGVVAFQGEGKVGYAWAADDVGNMSRTAQKVKRVAGRFTGDKPYAWNAQINVDPEFQDEGTGSILLKEVLAPFDGDQRASAYVFNENQATLGWFKRRGFRPEPSAPVDPNGRPDGPDMYFGEGAEHVLQWRLEAPSVVAVLRAINERHPDLPSYTVVDR